jgi:hypothetical protein
MRCENARNLKQWDFLYTTQTHIHFVWRCCELFNSKKLTRGRALAAFEWHLKYSSLLYGIFAQTILYRVGTEMQAPSQRRQNNLVYPESDEKKLSNENSVSFG